MKLVAVACICLAGYVLADGEGLNPKHKPLDLDQILNSDRVITSYVNCFLDQGPCSPEGEECKELMPEIFTTACARCSDKEKVLVRKVMKAGMERKKDDWEKIVDKYDPGRHHHEELLKFIHEE